ncbi:MAG: GNAT family N-acetyltransferase [Candidatus Latescibacteria bacterium]|nr:GNAT family N-acetyltransferase [Candidatus Latescibacterota bacterium]
MSKILQHYSISVEMNADQKDIDFVSEHLSADAELKANSPKNHHKLSVFARNNEANLVGGLVADIAWGWLYILKIWIQESHRFQGIGTQLLKTAEAEAIKYGCRYAYLDTFSFQARPLYEKLGYEVFGTLENYPPGHKKYFMRKLLDS